MTEARIYTSRRIAIVNALTEKLKVINGSFPYQADLENRVFSKMVFWDAVPEFPAVYLSAGPESRLYQGGGYKDRFMGLTIRCYINQEDATLALEGLLEDIETVLEDNSRIAFTDRQGNTQYTQQISIISIDTDEGILEPLGVGEISCEVRY